MGKPGVGDATAATGDGHAAKHRHHRDEQQHTEPPSHRDIFQSLFKDLGMQAMALESILRVVCGKVDKLEHWVTEVSFGMTELDLKLRNIAHNIEGTAANVDDDRSVGRWTMPPEDDDENDKLKRAAATVVKKVGVGGHKKKPMRMTGMVANILDQLTTVAETSAATESESEHSSKPKKAKEKKKTLRGGDDSGVVSSAATTPRADAKKPKKKSAKADTMTELATPLAIKSEMLAPEKSEGTANSVASETPHEPSVDHVGMVEHESTVDEPRQTDKPVEAEAQELCPSMPVEATPQTVLDNAGPEVVQEVPKSVDHPANEEIAADSQETTEKDAADPPTDDSSRDDEIEQLNVEAKVATTTPAAEPPVSTTREEPVDKLEDACHQEESTLVRQPTVKQPMEDVDEASTSSVTATPMETAVPPQAEAVVAPQIAVEEISEPATVVSATKATDNEVIRHDVDAPGIIVTPSVAHTAAVVGHEASSPVAEADINIDEPAAPVTSVDHAERTRPASARTDSVDAAPRENPPLPSPRAPVSDMPVHSEVVPTALSHSRASPRVHSKATDQSPPQASTAEPTPATVSPNSPPSTESAASSSITSAATDSKREVKSVPLNHKSHERLPPTKRHSRKASIRQLIAQRQPSIKKKQSAAATVPTVLSTSSTVASIPAPATAPANAHHKSRVLPVTGTTKQQPNDHDADGDNADGDGDDDDDVDDDVDDDDDDDDSDELSDDSDASVLDLINDAAAKPTSTQNAATPTDKPKMPAKMSRTLTALDKLKKANVLTPKETAELKQRATGKWFKLRDHVKDKAKKDVTNILLKRKKNIFTVSNRIELLEEKSREVYASIKQFTTELKGKVELTTFEGLRRHVNDVHVSLQLLSQRLAKGSLPSLENLRELAKEVELLRASTAHQLILTREHCDANHNQTLALFDDHWARVAMIEKDVEVKLRQLAADCDEKLLRLPDYNEALEALRRSIRKKADLKVLRELEARLLGQDTDGDDCLVRCLSCHKEVVPDPTVHDEPESVFGGDGGHFKRVNPGTASTRVYRSNVPLNAHLLGLSDSTPQLSPPSDDLATQSSKSSTPSKRAARSDAPTPLSFIHVAGTRSVANEQIRPISAPSSALKKKLPQKS